MYADICNCGCGFDGQAAFPANASTALNYHFGMLLGVEDLRAEQGFHLGQIVRHHRELHGVGVVRGMGVSYDPETGELKVAPGFAVNLEGRPIEIARAQCLDLVTWVEQNRTTLPLLADIDRGIDLDLVVSAGACLERPVQAIAAECNGSNEDIAYSRLTERAELELVAAPPANVAPPPDPLGDLFSALADGIYAPPATDVEGTRLAALAIGAAAPGADPRSWAGVARQALLVASLNRPAPGPAAGEETHLLLARLEGVRRTSPPAGVSIQIQAIRTELRALLLPESFLQPRQPFAVPPVPSLGPWVTGAALAGLVVTLGFDRGVAPASLVPSAFQLLDLTPASLAPAAFTLTPTGPAAAPTGVTLTLAAAPQGKLRLVALGTGPNPIVDANFRTLGERAGEDGRNFITIL